MAHPDDISPKDYLKMLPSPVDEASREVEDKMEMALRNVTTARRADELAAEIGGEVAESYGFHNGSDEYDELVSLANNIASEAFPGNWEDYPRV